LAFDSPRHRRRSSDERCEATAPLLRRSLESQVIDHPVDVAGVDGQGYAIVVGISANILYKFNPDWICLPATDDSNCLEVPLVRS
jgi:hypothetical protein